MIYDVFIDESGLFIETSTAAADRVKSHKDKNKFPSQLAAAICESGRITVANARTLIERSLTKAGLPIEHDFHATSIKSRSKPGFDRFVESLVAELRAASFQPARIVNEEGVSFGDRVANYTNILAEFLVRVCRQLSINSKEEVKLNVFAAKVRGDEDEQGVFEIFAQTEYVNRVREYFARAAVANGWSGASAKWKIGTFQLASGKDDPRLWLADAVSNSSHNNFATIGEGAGLALKNALTAYDWTLSFDQTLQLTSELIEREAFGLAIISLAERIDSEATSEEANKAYLSQVRGIVPRLNAMPPSVKYPQLQIILGWLQQLVELRSDPARSIRICGWLEQELCNVTGSTFDIVVNEWLRLAITTWALTACNHDGDTTAARMYADQVDAILPRVTGRWEFISDIMQAIVAKGVHQNDCFEHAVARDSLAKVVKYYQDLGGFFGDAYPELFKSPIRSDQCGKALGTKLQSETFLLLSGLGQFEEARATSDAAIAEFASNADRNRQYQYRSEVEAIAGDWAVARRYLAMSFEISSHSHDALAAHIRTIVHPVAQGFALLHWTRVGGMAAVAGAAQELSDFKVALLREKLEYNEWVQGKVLTYPCHGILRRIACVFAAVGDVNATLTALGRLDSLVQSKPRPIFRLIEIAALMQCAGLLANKDSEKAIALLLGTKNKRGVLERIRSLKADTGSNLPRFGEILSSWEQQVGDIENANTVELSIAAIAASVGY